MPTKNNFECQYLYGTQILVKAGQQSLLYRLDYAPRLHQDCLTVHQKHLDVVAQGLELLIGLPLGMVRLWDIPARLNRCRHLHSLWVYKLARGLL